MSNMPEINPDDANSGSSALVILHAVQKHHALVKVNRVLILLIFFLMSVVFAMGFVFVPKHRLMTQTAQNQAVIAEQALQNPVISAEINMLKGQLFGLVSGSIESKLRSLEDNIKRGSLVESLNTIQDLKSDVKVLNAYTSAPQVKVQEATANQQLIKELTELKDLVYLTFISCGLMIAAVAGIWIRHRYRLTHHKNQTIYLGQGRHHD